MEKKEILEAIQQLKKDSPKRNFSQSYDFLVKLQHFDPKKNENKVDVFVALPYFLGRKQTVCGLVGGALYNDAKANCDHTIGQEEFKTLAGNGKELKKLARKYDFFIAQADIMGPIATTFRSKANCDHTIGQEEFKTLAGNGKELKKLARKYDFFIAQADIMGPIATTF